MEAGSVSFSFSQRVATWASASMVWRLSLSVSREVLSSLSASTCNSFNYFSASKSFSLSSLTFPGGSFWICSSWRALYCPWIFSVCCQIVRISWACLSSFALSRSNCLWASANLWALSQRVTFSSALIFWKSWPGRFWPMFCLRSLSGNRWNYLKVFWSLPPSGLPPQPT